MEYDHKWLAHYLEAEIGRLRGIENKAKAQEEEAIGNIAKYDHLISLETARDEEYQRAKRIEERKLEHPRAVLANLTPKLDKMVEQYAIAAAKAGIPL